MTSTFLDLPSPLGMTTVPRTIWSCVLGIDAQPHVDFHRLVEFRVLDLLEKGTACSSWYSLASTCSGRIDNVCLLCVPCYLIGASGPFPKKADEPPIELFSNGTACSVPNREKNCLLAQRAGKYSET